MIPGIENLYRIYQVYPVPHAPQSEVSIDIDIGNYRMDHDDSNVQVINLSTLFTSYGTVFITGRS